MPGFTSTERRSLYLALALVAIGTAGRLWLGPGSAEFAWRPAAAGAPGAEEAATTADVRAGVRDAIALREEASRPLAPGERLDINAADAVQLQRLPGVGPGRAAAILRTREARGRFASVEELTLVPGVGVTLLGRWRPHLHASGADGPRAPPVPAGRALDLNRAHPNELEQITGIGPVLARRIVEERARRGGFRTIEEVREIPGIGPETLKRLRERVYVR